LATEQRRVGFPTDLELLSPVSLAGSPLRGSFTRRAQSRVASGVSMIGVFPLAGRRTLPSLVSVATKPTEDGPFGKDRNLEDHNAKLERGIDPLGN